MEDVTCGNGRGKTEVFAPIGVFERVPFIVPTSIVIAVSKGVSIAGTVGVALRKWKGRAHSTLWFRTGLPTTGWRMPVGPHHPGVATIVGWSPMERWVNELIRRAMLRIP